MKHVERLMMAATAVAAVTIGASADTLTFHVDPARSRATIHVGKAGAFSFIAGHTHEVVGPVQSGTIDLDRDDPSRSHVRLVIPASELKVSAEREPEGDAPKVQEAMESDKVLDVAHHPQITYESARVAVSRRDNDRFDLTITGRLTIRDVTREVTAPVHVALGGDALTCTGRLEVKQSAFGIKPISVGGVVAVKDTLEIDFTVLAHK